MNRNVSKISFSNKVTLLSFALCCGVVSLHVKKPILGETIWEDFSKFYVFLLNTCVPIFFMLSGYLFFRKYQSGMWQSKLTSRIKTLLVPYVIWNILYTIYMHTINSFGLIRGRIDNDTLSIISSCLNSDYSPLWFIKYLMFFVMISPLMYYLLRSKWGGGIVIVTLLVINAWNYYSGAMQVPLHVNANNWIMFVYQYVFFAVGSYTALCFKNSVENFSKNKSIISSCILVALVTCYWCYIRTSGDVVSNHLFRLLWGISLWFTLDLLPEINVRPWMKYSFFIYCAHTILIQPVQGITRILTQSELFKVIEYVVLPIIVIWALILIANLLKSKCVICWNIITGNRG